MRRLGTDLDTGRGRALTGKGPSFAAGPSKRSRMANVVSLREVTASTVRAVTDLRVSPDQERYVASNAVSIAQAYFHPEAWFRAVYQDDELCGFVMLRESALSTLQSERQEFSLWRFMIDHRFQRAGLGRKALSLVVELRCAAHLVRFRPDEPGQFLSIVRFRAHGRD